MEGGGALGPQRREAPVDASHDREESSRPIRRASDQGWGAAVYLSNDDTMSLSSAQRVIYAIENFAPIPAEHVRPHELLNYFSFDTEPVQEESDFSVVADLGAASSGRDGELSLALAVQGRAVTRAERRPANLSFVVDRSGSMAAEGRMEYLKRGLLRATEELKTGDIVHLTLFDSSACELAQNFVVGRDSMSQLRGLIQRIAPEGSTNLHEGLSQGYELAQAAYQADYSNRVILVTDAQTNTGIVDEEMIALVGEQHDRRRIRLSGIGVGSDFNDALLDRLTERGRGAYVFLGSAAEVDAVFGERFVSLIETMASDVHFQLQLPPSLALRTFYGEEASVHKERVQAIHYFAGTAQLFLSDLEARPGFEEDDILLRIEYESPDSGEARVEEFAFRLGQLGASHNLKKAALLTAFSQGLLDLAHSPLSAEYRQQRHGYVDAQGAARCSALLKEVEREARPISSDPEVRRVVSLTRTLCERYQSAPRPEPRPVQRRNEFAPSDQWPGAR